MFYATGLRTRFCLRNVDTKRFICTFINPLYAGHSKWANIKHIKAEKDGQKAALFTRLSRQIRLAIQEGGSADPGMNSQLRYVMDEALRKNMPMSTIQNSIKKCRASKEDLKKYLVELRYKQKVFTICVVYTEKFAAFKMELAPILKKAGATFAESKHMFEDFGLIEAVLQTNLASEINFENLATNDAIESGSEDLEIVDSSKGSVNFVCNPQNINIVKKSLEAKGYLIENAVHVFAPKHLIELTNEEQDAYQKFLAKLREISGLEDVYDNVGVQSG